MLTAGLTFGMLTGCGGEEKKTYDQACADLAQGSYDYALQGYQSSITAGYKKAEAYRGAGIANIHLGNYQDAIDSLTLEEMDTYSMVSRRIQTEDVFTIVDTFFMPFGMECDHYQIMGEIQSYRKVKNIRSKEYLYQIKILCNDIEMEICINEADLLGDPDVGRRFKGNVWLQGYIHFPED